MKRNARRRVFVLLGAFAAVAISLGIAVVLGGRQPANEEPMPMIAAFRAELHRLVAIEDDEQFFEEWSGYLVERFGTAIPVQFGGSALLPAGGHRIPMDDLGVDRFVMLEREGQAHEIEGVRGVWLWRADSPRDVPERLSVDISPDDVVLVKAGDAVFLVFLKQGVVQRFKRHPGQAETP